MKTKTISLTVKPLSYFIDEPRMSELRQNLVCPVFGHGRLKKVELPKPKRTLYFCKHCNCYFEME